MFNLKEEYKLFAPKTVLKSEGKRTRADGAKGNA